MAQFYIGQRLTHHDSDYRHHVWVVLSINRTSGMYLLQKLTPDVGRPLDYSIDDVERQLLALSHIRRP